MDVNKLKPDISDINASRRDNSLTSWEQYRAAVIQEAAMQQALQPCGLSSYGDSSAYWQSSYNTGSYVTGSYISSSNSVISSCCNADIDVTRLGYGLRLI